MSNISPEQYNQIKAQAIKELLEAAKQQNIQTNEALVAFGEQDKVRAFTSVPVRYITNYLETLKDE